MATFISKLDHLFTEFLKVFNPVESYHVIRTWKVKIQGEIHTVEYHYENLTHYRTQVLVDGQPIEAQPSRKRIPHLIEFELRNLPCSLLIYKGQRDLTADLDINRTMMVEGDAINEINLT